MATINSEIISLSVTSARRYVDVNKKIRSGDTTITLTITWSDIETIAGQIALHFARGDTYLTEALVTPVANAFSYVIPADLLSEPGLVVWCRAVDGDDIFTPLKVSFVGLESIPTGDPITILDQYPDWLQAIIDANAAAANANAAVSNMIQTITQEQYDALTPPSENTIYFVGVT